MTVELINILDGGILRRALRGLRATMGTGARPLTLAPRHGFSVGYEVRATMQ